VGWLDSQACKSLKSSIGASETYESLITWPSHPSKCLKKVMGYIGELHKCAKETVL
jgi:hypothetical protein